MIKIRVVSLCCLVLLGSSSLVVHGQQQEQQQEQQEQHHEAKNIRTGRQQPRRSNKLRRKQPPNRRLRRGKVFQNGEGRDAFEWEDEKAPKSEAALGDGLLGHKGGAGGGGGGVLKGAAQQAFLESDQGSSGTREQYDALIVDWTSWGVQWVQDRAGVGPFGEAIQVTDRAGGEEGTGILSTTKAGGQRQERGKKAGGNPKAGKRKGSSGYKTTKKRRGKKGKRRLQDRINLTGQTGADSDWDMNKEGNVFAGPNKEDARAVLGDSSGFDEVQQAAKNSIGKLKDLDLFSNSPEWQHTFFVPVDGADEITRDKVDDEEDEATQDQVEKKGKEEKITQEQGEDQEEKNGKKENISQEQVEDPEKDKGKGANEEKGKKQDHDEGENVGDPGVQQVAFDKYSYKNYSRDEEAATPAEEAAAPEDDPTPKDAIQPENPNPTDEEVEDKEEEEEPEAKGDASVSDTDTGDDEDEETFGWEDSTKDGDWINEPSEQLNKMIQRNTDSPSDSPSSVPSDAPSIIPTMYPTQDRSDCQICSHGHTPLYPDRTILHTKQTCEDLAGALDFAPGGTCGGLKADIPIDLEAYCGCEGVSSSSWCTFCPEGTTNIYASVAIPALNGMTCQNVEQYSAFISDQEACDNMAHLAGLCCGSLNSYWQSP